MVPRLLQEWTFERLKHLLENRYLEPESFDYKSRLPNPKDGEGKKRLRDACAAFANSSGGFLVFGIEDDKQLPAEQRLVGIPDTIDFPAQFGSFPAQCNPSVRWDFLNPPPRLANGNVIQVVWFPTSWNRPHSVGRPEEGFRFPKRTNKGTEYMSFEEVRMAFLGLYEKRLKLQLLQAELANIIADAKALIIAPEQAHTTISVVSFRLDMLESVLVDTFTILADQTDLIQLLNGIRSRARNVNNKLAMFLPTVHQPLTHAEERNREHNEWLRNNVPAIQELAEQALKHLTRFLAAS